MPTGSTRCDFCFAVPPTAQAEWMKTEAVKFMNASRNKETIHVGPRSKSFALAASLMQLRVFKLKRHDRSSRVSSYTWTDYGHALRDACARASRSAA